jgi:hypothetical protein
MRMAYILCFLMAAFSVAAAAGDDLKQEIALLRICEPPGVTLRAFLFAPRRESAQIIPDRPAIGEDQG